MSKVTAFARCNRCNAGRVFVKISKRGYECTVCKGPKPRTSPLKQRRES